MSSNNASERIAWAVDRLDVQPSDQILEIGCGHGVAVTLVCDRLEKGHILAIDRSDKMIAMARKRNETCEIAGKASFQAVPLRDADFAAASFDKIFAIRVGIFMRGNPARELAIIRAALKKDGRFYIIYDPFDASEVDALVDNVSVVLMKHDFSIETVHKQNIGGTTVVCVVAQ